MLIARLIAWRTGYAGVTFHLAVQGDTLRGRVRFAVEIACREPLVTLTWAARVSCPN